MDALNTEPAAKGSRNMYEICEPRSFSRCKKTCWCISDSSMCRFGWKSVFTFSILLKCNAYLSCALNCINLMLELCDSSVMLFIVGKNLKINNVRWCSAKVHWEMLQLFLETSRYGKAEKRSMKHLLEHCLHGNDCVTIAQGVLFSRVRNLFVHDHDVLGESDARPQ